ncbi:hypothetical protein Tco_0199704 [Tanacetum coccineum]
MGEGGRREEKKEKKKEWGRGIRKKELREKEVEKRVKRRRAKSERGKGREERRKRGERGEKSLEVGSIRRIQGVGYGELGFLGVGTMFDIFQNIILIPYIEYGVLRSSRYGVLISFLLWSLVSAGTDTPYLLDRYGILVF